MNLFFSRLWQETLKSLRETFQLFEGGENGLTVLADLAAKVLVSGLLVSVFFGIYFLLRTALNRLFSRLRLSQELKLSVTLALRYMMVVMTLLALLLQYGVPTTLTSAVARAALMLFAFFVLWLITDRFLGTYLKGRNLDLSLVQLLKNVLSVVLGIVALTTVLAQFGINVFSIITTLGVVGIAVGFAAQETLSNFIAGITLLIERPFRIGDWVKMDGATGKVQEINLRTTRLQTRDNELLVIPNATVASSKLVNLSAGGPLRIRIPIGIAYKEKASEARDILAPILEQQPNILKTPAPSVRLIALADSSQNLELVYWLAPENIDNEPKLTYALLEEAKTLLDEADIEIPFPHLQLFVDGLKALEPIIERVEQRQVGKTRL